MKWSKCLYGTAADRAGPCGNLSAIVQQLHDQTATMFDGRIEGDNLNPGMFGAGIILAPNPPVPPPPPPPLPLPTPNKRQRLYPLGDYPGRYQIKVPLADRDTMAFMQKKGTDFQREDLKPGIEFVVDATDATNGRVCVVGRSNTDKQIGSMIPEDPVLNANPKMSWMANYGKAVLGTSGAFNWELHRNGAASLTDDGTQIDTSRKYRTSSQVESTVATGTAPLVVASTTKVTNLNADLLDGLDSTAFALALSGTLNKVAKFNSTTTIGDSTVTDDGTSLTTTNQTISGTNSSGLVIQGSKGVTVKAGLVSYAVTVQACDGGALDIGAQGATTIRGADTARTSNDAIGGALTARGGDASSAASGGAGVFRGGDAAGVGTGGAATLRAGNSASGTKGVLDIQHADGTTRIKIDASGNTLFTGVQATSGQLLKADAAGSPVTAGNAAAVRTLIGTVIGTDVEAHDATLTALAGLATGANKIPYSTGTDTFSQKSVSKVPAADTVALGDDDGRLDDWISGPVWQTFTISETQFTAAATSERIALYTAPIGAVLHAIILIPKTKFTGGGLTEFTLEIGQAADEDVYMDAYTVFTATPGTAAYYMGYPGGYLLSADATTAITITARSDASHTVAAATAGQCVVRILMSVIPA